MPTRTQIEQFSGNSPFVWVYQFNSSGPAERAKDPAPREFGEASGGFKWLHINLADTRYRDWLSDANCLPAGARTLLLGHDEHQSLMGADASLWGSLADFCLQMNEKEDRIGHLRFCVAGNFLITARRRPLQSIEHVRQLIDAGKPFETPLSLFESIVERIIDSMTEETDQLVTEINSIEDKVLGSIGRQIQKLLAPLRRKALMLHRQVTGLHRVLVRYDQPSRLPPAEHQVLQRLLQKLESTHHDLHGNTERTRQLQEEIANKLAEQTNHQLYVLTVVSTLILPPTFITGIFGMNVKGLPFGDNEDAFLIVMGLCVVAASLAVGILRFVRQQDN